MIVAKSMLSILTKDRRAFKNFCRKGYFSYDNNKDCKGEVVILNKAIISLLQERKDSSKAIATVSFQNAGIFIYQLFGNDYSFSQFGEDPTILTDTTQVYFRKKEEVIQDINTIYKHCLEARKKASIIQKISSIIDKFDSILVQSDNKISDKEVSLLLQNTLDRLNQTRDLKELEQDLNR